MRRLGKAPPFPVLPVLEELTGETIDLLGSGSWGRRIRCPFHPDRSPSAAISHSGTGFDCKSCGRAGDAIKLLMEVENLDFVHALDRAKEITGIESDSVSGGAGQDQSSSDICDYLVHW